MVNKEDFTNYMSSALQNSMLTGIPQIFSAGNLPKKFIRAVVFILCLVGFIYQSIIFMNLYWEFRTVVDVQVINPSTEERPSITVCNGYGMQTSKICNSTEYIATGVRCVALDEDEDFCACLPRYCKNGELVSNLWDLVESYQFNLMPYEWRKKWMFTKEQFIKSCTEMKMQPGKIKSECEDPYYRQIGVFKELRYPEVCFTLNTVVERPEHKLPKVPTDGEIFIELEHYGYEYPLEIQSTQVFISIHGPHTVQDPFVDGYRLDPRLLYHFRLKKTIKNLLPAPYDSNCVDYMSMWKQRNGWGPTTLKECIVECRQNVSLSKYGCLGNYVQGAGNYLRCESAFVTDRNIVKDAADCVKEKCKPACYEEYYTSVRDLSIQSENKHCEDEDDFFHETSSVHIMMDGMETTIYTYSPAFEDIETFSYVGGYVGMWLGISLLAVFDFLETMVMMLKYPLRRYARFRARRIQIRDMHNNRNV